MLLACACLPQSVCNILLFSVSNVSCGPNSFSTDLDSAFLHIPPFVGGVAWPTALGHTRRGLSSLDGKVQAEIMNRCNELHASFIQPLNDTLHGPLEKLNTGGYQSTKMPFVFVLGNHSSGKSSFINYVLGRNIQTAGVAPTDDRWVCCCGCPSFSTGDKPGNSGCVESSHSASVEVRRCTVGCFVVRTCDS